MRKTLVITLGLALAVGLTACEPDTQLNVTNPNTADRDRAIGKPADVETLISGSFGSTVRGMYGSTNDNVQNQMMVMALESYSGLANFAMGPRAAIPRSLVINTVGNSVASGNTKEFTQLATAAKQASVGVNALGVNGFTIGTPAADLRARAFGNFVMGLSQGVVALIYDSATIITGSSAPGLVPPLVAYDSVMRGALALMDSALFYAANPAAAFPLPSTWLAGNAYTAAQFQQLVRSYKAWLRASVARSVAERAAVDWNAVLADAQAGITANFQLSTNTTTNFNIVWPGQHYLFGTWHQMTPLIIGMADTTPLANGGYGQWIAQPIGARGTGLGAPFTILTPDNRFPTGATLAAQLTYSGCSGATPPVCNRDYAVPYSVNSAPGVVPATFAGKPYFKARPAGENNWAGSWGDSPYDFYRFTAWYNSPSAAARTGNYPIFTLATNNGLIAEAAIRTGQWSVATAAINVSRTAAGLPSVTGMADLVAPVPGGQACVPKVPQPPNYNTIACGNLMEAMKWEKRLEGAYTTYGSWFLDSRGWGDLPAGTSVQWAVPYQELQVRLKPLYSLTVGSLPGTYGF